jgi:hypothetical protein
MRPVVNADDVVEEATALLDDASGSNVVVEARYEHALNALTVCDNETLA